MSNKRIISKSFIFALALSLSLTISTSSQAGLLGGLFSLLRGGIPVVEPVSTGSELGKLASVLITKGKAVLATEARKIENKITSKLPSFITQYFNTLDGFPQIMGTKHITPSTTLAEELGVEDLKYDEAAVKRAIYRLFLEYPSEDILIQQNYRKKAREFYEDSVIDAYAGSRELSKYLTSEVAAKFADLKTKLANTTYGGQDDDNMNGALYNNYIAAYLTMDSIVAVVQEATALKAQLEAAKAIRFQLEPLIYNGGKRCDNSHGSSPEIIVASATLGDSYEMSFAQTTASESSNSNGDGTYAELQDYQDRDSKGKLEFERGQDPVIINPLYDSKEKIEDLSILEPIYDNLKKTLIAHNLTHRLRYEKDNFERYQELLMLYARAKQQLSLSDQCAENLLENVFINPSQVWCGYSSCKNVDDYTTRGGLSAWALSAYDTAQAAQVQTYYDEGEYVEEEGVAMFSSNTWKIPTPKKPVDTSTYTLDTPVKKVEDVAEEAEYLEANQDKYAGDEMADEGRKTELLPWQVGAVGIESLVEDLSAWGAIRDSFRVWNDTRSFYTQYVMFKYENFYTKTRADTAKDIILQGMTGWNIANRNNAQKSVKEVAAENKEKAKKNAARSRAEAVAKAAVAAKKEEEYDLEGRMQEIEQELAAEIERIEKDLQKKLDSIEKEYNINESNFSQFSSIVTNVAERGDIIKEVTNAAISVGEAAKVALYYKSNPLGALYQKAKNIYKQADDYLFNSVEGLKTSLCPKGETIYRIDVAPTMHKNMVDSLIKYIIPIIDEYGVTVYKVKPYEKYFTDKDTSPEETEYFVGSMPQDRDLKAPKNPPKMYYAPFREVFHYDDIDVENSKPLTKKKFLSYGGKIPEIWKILLSDKNPFVEHSFDLKGILDGDYLHKNAFYKLTKHQGHWCPILQVQESKAERYLTLTRGGLTPCSISNVNITVNDNPEMDYFTSSQIMAVDVTEVSGNPYSYLPVSIINKELSNNGLGENPCVGITYIHKFFDNTFFNLLADAKFSVKLRDIKSSYGRSELGVFIKSDKYGNISFREDFAELIDKMSAIRGEYDNGRDINDDRNLSDSQKLEELALSMAMFDHNMIGSHIMVADTAREYRQALAKMEEEIEALRQTIIEEFASIGLEAPKDIDLSRRGDYDDCVDALEKYKGETLEILNKDIKSAKVENNNVLKTRLDRYKAARDALEQDKDEYLSLTENSVGGPELAEEIAEEKANWKAKEPYKNEASESLKEELDSMRAPYCPNINDGSYQVGCPVNQNLTARDERK